MLSTPPAFVLSQNQTLKFNCLKPSKFPYSTALSAFLLFLSLLTCFLVHSFKCFLKLTETFFSCSRNLSVTYLEFLIFPSIRFLNYLLTTTQLWRSLKSEPTYSNITHWVCQSFFHTFLKNFYFFWKFIFSFLFLRKWYALYTYARARIYFYGYEGRNGQEKTPLPRRTKEFFFFFIGFSFFLLIFVFLYQFFVLL